MKFNIMTKATNKVLNHEGEVAYQTTPEMELYAAVVTASLSNSFYEKGSDRLERITRLIGKVDPVFVARLAIYARDKMNLRSVPLVLVTELSKRHNGDSLVKKATARVIRRADEITELLAYYQLSNARNGDKKLHKMSKQIQKGIADAFNKFDEYQFAKYNRKTEITFKDALFLTHPKAANETQQNLFDKIISGNLETPYTWEVELSELGKQSFTTEIEKARAFRKKWEELITSGRLGYMALMRNLRNILEANVEASAIRTVLNRLSDPAEIRKAKQFPFRYLAAYNELVELKLNYVSAVLKALEKAIKISAENISGFDLETRILLAADVSGSMFTPVGRKGKIRCYDIGLVLSMLMANRSENVVTGIFGDSWREVSLTGTDILSNVSRLNKMEGSVGYSTNGYRVIESLIKSLRVMDKVMMFTDLQLWDSRYGGNNLKGSWINYKKTVAPNAKLYLFDLVGYGQTPLSVQRDDVHLIAGWSDKIFDILEAIENGSDAVKEIMKIEI
ncbi:MAG: TROVE domain-containing protein [Bacteroidota bacterium]